MTTDRSQPARPDRPGAVPAERRDGDAFAALLGAHAPARPAAEPHDDRAPHAPRPETAHDPVSPAPEGAAAGPDGDGLLVRPLGNKVVGEVFVL